MNLDGGHQFTLLRLDLVANVSNDLQDKSNIDVLKEEQPHDLPQ